MFLSLLILLISLIGFFITAWIVLPAPNMLLLTLAVGAPEFSPWLFIFNLFSLLLSSHIIKSGNIKFLACGFSIIGLIICALLLINTPISQTTMQSNFEQNLGRSYLEKVPKDVLARMRKTPFSMLDAFRGIPSGRVSHLSNINFANPGGVKLNMEVYKPTKKGKNPALVIIYGGAWRSGSPRNYEDFSYYMANQGYTVFAIAYRHAPKYKFPAQIEDVRSALQYIRDRADEYDADPNQMILFGRSAGAHLAMLAAYADDAPPIRAVVNYYGPINLVGGYNQPPIPDPINSRDVLENFIGGSPQEFPLQYQAASPINYVKSALPPTLLIYGGRDNLVEAKYGRAMYEKLKEKNNTAVFLEIPWAEHAFDTIFYGVSNQLALFYTERFMAWSIYR